MKLVYLFFFQAILALISGKEKEEYDELLRKIVIKYLTQMKSNNLEIPMVNDDDFGSVSTYF